MPYATLLVTYGMPRETDDTYPVLRFHGRPHYAGTRRCKCHPECWLMTLVTDSTRYVVHQYWQAVTDDLFSEARI